MPPVHKAIHRDDPSYLIEPRSGLWGRITVHVLGEAAERGLCGAELPGAPANPVRQLWGEPAERKKALDKLSRALAASPPRFVGQVELCKGCQTNVARMAAKAAEGSEAK